MAITVQTNAATLSTLQHLNSSQAQVNKSLEALATGKTINSAADDPAAYEALARLDGSKQRLLAAQENVLTAQAIGKTANAGMNKIGNALNELQSLASRAASGTANDADRNNMNATAQGLLETIDQVANGTRFNGQDLLNNTATLTVQIGGSATTADQLAYPLSNNTAAGLLIDGIDLGTSAGARDALTRLDAAASQLVDNQASIGAVGNQLGVLAANVGTAMEQNMGAAFAIQNMDTARLTVEKTQQDMMSQASIALQAQANQQNQNVLMLLR